LGPYAGLGTGGWLVAPCEIGRTTNQDCSTAHWLSFGKEACRWGRKLITPTCRSNGVPSSLWVDRPKGCWGSGHDGFWFNTNTDDSTMCQKDRDNRDNQPGNDLDGKCLGEESFLIQ